MRNVCAFSQGLAWSPTPTHAGGGGAVLLPEDGGGARGQLLAEELLQDLRGKEAGAQFRVANWHFSMPEIRKIWHSRKRFGIENFKIYLLFGNFFHKNSYLLFGIRNFEIY